MAVVNRLRSQTKSGDSGKSPRVSIGLPVYNGEQFLEYTIDSILEQTYTDFELIISDNASTDRTAEIIQEYAQKDPRVRHCRTDTNLGASYNFNRVLELATGEYFRWAAADDVIAPNFLELCVQVLDKHPEVVIAYSKAGFIDENNCITYYFDDLIHLKPWSDAVVPRTIQLLTSIIIDGSTANVIIFGLARTRVMQAIRPLGNYFGPDYTIVTELSLEGQFSEIPQVLSFYRRHQKSSSTYKKAPSAAEQQIFLDPNITGKMRQQLQLRRRYYEIFRAIVKAKIGIFQRLILLLAYLGLIGFRILWRLVFEIRFMLGVPPKTPVRKGDPTIGLPWSQLS
jgi:glycosyltransferase involved in cell wall biosynthesis